MNDEQRSDVVMTLGAITTVVGGLAATILYMAFVISSMNLVASAGGGFFFLMLTLSAWLGAVAGAAWLVKRRLER